MRMYDVIEKKKRGGKLTKDEIEFVIDGFTKGEIPDYQMSAFLMAVWFNGMDKEETYELTMSMANSGNRLDLGLINGIKVDKHSTGGVGDKTTLIIGPIVAALGVPVAKMSGRGLGHTGGTIDKLESIAGFNTSISTEHFINQVNDLHIAIAGQTANLAPADKKIYALRDVTATVDNVSLIASSIMSKKLASGADAIVLDVKCGNGAFMKDLESANTLAEEMVSIGKMAGKKMTAIITDMNEPLGRYVGNSLEIYEAVLCLKGNGDKKLMEVCNVLASYMLIFAGVAKDETEAEKLIKETIESGKALEKLCQLVKAQGGDEKYIKNEGILPRAYKKIEFLSKNDGFVSKMDTELVGKACLALGGGRLTKESTIDLSVGIYLNKKTGEEVKAGQAIATIYSSDDKKGMDALGILEKAYSFSDDKPVEQISMIKNIVS